MSKIPEILIDNEGYPTVELLMFIREYSFDTMPLMDFIEQVLIPSWWMNDWGVKLHRTYKGVRKLELHTGGWSGNELIIREVLSNIYLTHFTMRYVMWKTGGHYYFEIKNPDAYSK